MCCGQEKARRRARFEAKKKEIQDRNAQRVAEEAEIAHEEWEPTLEAIPKGEDERSDSFQSCQEGGSSGSDHAPGEWDNIFGYAKKEEAGAEQMRILWTSVGSDFMAKQQDAPATRRNNQVLTKAEVDENWLEVESAMKKELV